MKKNILLVEDEPLIQKMFAQMLDFCGYSANVVASGSEALTELNNGHKYDLVLMDIMMPGDNGIATLEKIKKSDKLKQLPVIIMSNLAGRNDMKLAISKGAADCIGKKDVEIEVLKAKIDKALTA